MKNPEGVTLLLKKFKYPIAASDCSLKFYITPSGCCLQDFTSSIIMPSLRDYVELESTSVPWFQDQNMNRDSLPIVLIPKTPKG